jgi:hypothetical protein
MKLSVAITLISCAAVIACRHHEPPKRERPRLGSSGWIEETAARRGYVKPGDVAQFGCPPGWRGVEDTAAALRGREVSSVYLGPDPPPYEGTITCVAQAEFALPEPNTANMSRQPPFRQPLAPVWVDLAVDSVTIGFRSELPLDAAIYFGRETPCGPRVIGVRLGDLMNWLVDPQAAPKRDFLGMTSGGCPEREAPRRSSVGH